MREVLALILTAIVAYVIYSVFFASEVHETGPPPADSTFPMELVISMEESGSVVHRGTRYTLGLGLVSDDRCPLGQDCDAPGEAKIVAWLKIPGKRRSEVRLTTASEELVNAGSLSVRLVLVEPYPRPGYKIKGEDYKVTLELAYAVQPEGENPVEEAGEGATEDDTQEAVGSGG